MCLEFVEGIPAVEMEVAMQGDFVDTDKVSVSAVCTPPDTAGGSLTRSDDTHQQTETDRHLLRDIRSERVRARKSRKMQNEHSKIIPNMSMSKMIDIFI